MLRPGIHVLRRTRTEIQVGLHPSRALVLADREPVRATLAALGRPGDRDAGLALDPGVLGLLHDAGLVTEIDRVLALLPRTADPDPAPRAQSPGSPPGTPPGTPPGPGVDAGDVAALAHRAGDDLAAPLARRAAGVVEVLPAGGAGAIAVAADLVSLLAAAGCRPRVVAPEVDVPCRPRARPAAARDTAGPVQVLGVLVVLGEPRREEADRWLREGTPHLVLRLTEGDALLGPLVVPGRTACLRCVDAHLTDVDPVWPLLVRQYADACARPRDDALPEPCDPVLARLAASWTARDVLTHLEGGSPSTLSTTVRFGPELSALETQTWSRHPGCGCTWA